jgi:membrane-associated protease RseP (regulator of RpoE activity)
MLDLEIISTLIFFSLVGFFIIKDRKKIEFSYGIIIRRWKKGKYVIDKLVRKHRKIIRKIGNVSIIIGIIASFIGMGFLIQFTLRLQRVFGIVLPTIAGFKYPGPVISIPFWYWIVSIFIIIASHETMHAIYSRAENVPIKNYGILLLFLLPIGAFVDPDMKVVKKLKTIKKLRIFSAGSFGNFLVCALIFFLFFASIKITDNLIESVGIRFESTIPDTPAAQIGLRGIIYKIDNQTIKNRIDLIKFLNKTIPGENITIFTTEGKFELTTIENPEVKGKAFIGISNISEIYKFKLFFNGYVPEGIIESLFIWYRFLYWVSILSLGVGIANLLPMKPFDGGYIFEEIFTKFFGKKGKFLTNVLSVLTISLIIFNLFGVGIIQKII